ncbi:hypothetical protein [Psychrobacter sp. UBA3962]|uniref:hypothetical protein n=1 Tax=Psychrobacter sp. UBA3962 TaxID=1947352 RepID=UPI0025FC251A|nr:hypothetical protein [Psychrobacter sp. UBA3962]
MKYVVLKQHYGDRQYFEGEEREVDNKTDAKVLIDAGLIYLSKGSGTEERAAPKARNKMAPKANNKSE